MASPFEGAAARHPCTGRHRCLGSAAERWCVGCGGCWRWRCSPAVIPTLPTASLDQPTATLCPICYVYCVLRKLACERCGLHCIVSPDLFAFCSPTIFIPPPPPPLQRAPRAWWTSLPRTRWSRRPPIPLASRWVLGFDCLPRTLCLPFTVCVLDWHQKCRAGHACINQDRLGRCWHWQAARRSCAEIKTD